MHLKTLALWTGLLPIITVHAVYLIAATYHLVDWCIPYLDGCTSISKAGRYNPANYFFKAGMIPAAILMIIYWKLTYEWLLSLGDKRNRYTLTLQYLGIIAACFLIVYVIALGSEGHFYRILRRYGVILYFSLTYLAQLLLAYRLQCLTRAHKVQLPSSIYKLQLGLWICLLTIGLLSIPLRAFFGGIDHNSRIDNILEWNFAIFMDLYFVISYFAWKATRFKAAFSSH